MEKRVREGISNIGLSRKILQTDGDSANIICFSLLKHISLKWDKEITVHFRNGDTVLAECCLL